MKLVPSQTERTIFLLLLLVFMAMLIPQAWWSPRWSQSAMACNGWMLTYVCLLILTSVIAGTKRQIIVWLVSMGSLFVAYWWSSKSQPFGEFMDHLGGDVTGLVHPHEAYFRVAAICSVVFAASFAISFALDRFVGPVNGKAKSSPEPNTESAPQETKRMASGRIKLLIVAAVVLFSVQAASNLAGFGSGKSGFTSSYLLPLVASTITVLCCGAICRTKPVPSLFISFVAAIALTGAGVALAVQGGAGANSIFLVCTFAFFSAILMAAFGFLNSFS